MSRVVKLGKIGKRRMKKNPTYRRSLITLSGKRSKNVYAYGDAEGLSRADLMEAAKKFAAQHHEPILIRTVPVSEVMPRKNPLTAKGRKIKRAMVRTYGHDGESVFYASERAGKIRGVRRNPAYKVMRDGRLRVSFTGKDLKERGADQSVSGHFYVDRGGLLNFPPKLDYAHFSNKTERAIDQLVGEAETYSARHTFKSMRRNPAPRAVEAAARRFAPQSSHAEKIAYAARRFARFTGHKAERVEKLPFPENPGAGLAVGPVLMLGYSAVRDGKRQNYLHKFAKHARPMLVASHDGTALYLLGGRYKFTERGIVDAAR